MLFGGSIQFDGKGGISYVVKVPEKAKKSGFIEVQIDTNGGELVLEFAPAIAESLRVALNKIQAGSESVKVDQERSKCQVRPDIFLHFEQEEITMGFSGGDDPNPIEEEWPDLIIRNSRFDLSLCMNPSQTGAFADLCQRVVGLGAAAKAFDERVIGLAEEAD